MRFERRTPQAAQQPSDDLVLLTLRKRAKRCSGLAPLEKHRTEIIVSVEQPHRWITIPETQAVNLVLALEMRHAELQHGGRSGRERHRRHPRAAHIVTIEWDSDGDRPAAFEIADTSGQSGEPCRSLGCAAAVLEQPRGHGKGHLSEVLSSASEMRRDVAGDGVGTLAVDGVGRV